MLEDDVPPRHADSPSIAEAIKEYFNGVFMTSLRKNEGVVAVWLAVAAVPSDTRVSAFVGLA